MIKKRIKSDFTTTFHQICQQSNKKESLKKFKMQMTWKVTTRFSQCLLKIQVLQPLSKTRKMSKFINSAFKTFVFKNKMLWLFSYKMWRMYRNCKHLKRKIVSQQCTAQMCLMKWELRCQPALTLLTYYSQLRKIQPKENISRLLSSLVYSCLTM